MTSSRRELLAGAGAAIALANLRARATAGTDGAAEKLLADVAEELMVDYPENESGLGIDTGPRTALQSRLSDRSAEGQQEIARLVAKRLERLKAVDASALNATTRLDLNVTRTAHEIARDGFDFPYGDTAMINANWSYRNAPYVVAQNTGAFLEIPSFLDTSHTVESREDAEAYLSRLEAYAGQLDGETQRLKSAAGQGVFATDFLLDKTLAQIKIARYG